MEEALFDEKERAQVTLNSIGDAVISTDIGGQITFLNLAAQNMTGWRLTEAVGQPLADVFRILDATSRDPIRDPTEMAVGRDRTFHLPPNCLLIRRDGTESPSKTPSPRSTTAMGRRPARSSCSATSARHARCRCR